MFAVAMNFVDTEFIIQHINRIAQQVYVVTLRNTGSLEFLIKMNFGP